MQSNVKVREIVAGHFGIDPKRVTDEARFHDDLGADWLDRLEVTSRRPKKGASLHEHPTLPAGGKEDRIG
jgi:hypothetical protein